MASVFVSNVTQYTGPGILQVLCQKGYKVICHDKEFAQETKRTEFAKRYGVTCIKEQAPADIARALQSFQDLIRYIFNDVHPNTPKPFEAIALNELSDAFDALVTFPFELSQAIYQRLIPQKTGHLLFVTSARQLQPEPGFAVATTVRSAATAMALSLAREAAPKNIQVNVLQPNYLYSELYYPKAYFVDTETGREEIASKVPMGRLGKPEEIGELAELFISGRTAFTTGQVINFTGGWP